MTAGSRLGSTLCVCQNIKPWQARGWDGLRVASFRRDKLLLCPRQASEAEEDLFQRARLSFNTDLAGGEKLQDQNRQVASHRGDTPGLGPSLVLSRPGVPSFFFFLKFLPAWACL